jgi:carotenoid cleavage dioxygenase
MATAGLPLHLAGNNRPVADEVTVPLGPADVVGQVPSELCGRFLRNGPNPRTGWSTHLYDGDGMVHAVTLRDGAAVEYRNRWVRTRLWASPGTVRRGDLRVTTANTHVVAHAGRLLALEEGGLPYEITPDLDTVGPYDFGGRLATPMTAHPKTCPTTGELLFFGYRLRPPYLTCHWAAPSGELVRSVPVDLPAATMQHDFAITATRLVVMDSPLVFDPAAPPWRWDDDHPARLGLLPRSAVADDVIWFEIAPGHLSHAANAYDEGDGVGGRVVLTGTRLPKDGLPALHRWTLDPASGRVTEEPLDDTPSEYPRIADARTGLPNRFVYTASFEMAAEPHHSELHKYDLATASAAGTSVAAVRTTHRFPPGHTCGEPVFVARPSARSEDDGWLLTYAHDRATGTSYLAILDAADMAAPPVARVHLRTRVPAGFHGTWLPDG